MQVWAKRDVDSRKERGYQCKMQWGVTDSKIEAEATGMIIKDKEELVKFCAKLQMAALIHIPAEVIVGDGREGA